MVLFNLVPCVDIFQYISQLPVAADTFPVPYCILDDQGCGPVNKNRDPVFFHVYPGYLQDRTGCKDTGQGAGLSELGYQALTRPKSYHLKKA